MTELDKVLDKMAGGLAIVEQVVKDAGAGQFAYVQVDLGEAVRLLKQAREVVAGLGPGGVT